MMNPTCLLNRMWLAACTGLAIACCVCQGAWSQQASPIPVEAGTGEVIPASYQGAGSFFNRKLGTTLRFSYNTEGYGVQDDVITLGSMKVFNLDEATFFLDGQATLSDDFGGGFNAGVGYRELVDTSLSFDPLRMNGISFWTDGQSTSADNFFTQLGISLESLGESFDARLNASFPLDRTKTGDARLTSIGTPIFMGNHLFSEVYVESTDTAHSVVDGELAKRISNLEAWAFLGGYQIGGGSVDATGYRVGVRGYAMPDLALSLQVTDDDVYHTNVSFGLTWFVGRTHRCNQPCGNIYDRFREPVMRNNFIATTQVANVVAGGDPLRDANTGDDLRFVHVDSTAVGGDGTFENPFADFTGVPAASQDNDTILVHAGSVLAGQYALKDGQRVIGEGGNIVHTANTLELGVVNLPETASGALAGAVPVISGVGDVFTMANDNEINNFTITGGSRAVFADGVNAPVLRNLAISDTTSDGVVMANITGAGSIDDTVSITNAAGIGLLVDGGAEAASYSPTIVNSAGQAVVVRNRTDGTLTIGSMVTDTGAGVRVEDNTGGTINFTNAMSLATTTNDAVRLTNNTGATINFSGGLDIDTTSGTGFFADGGGTISATGQNTIVADTGVGLDLNNMTIGANDFTFDSVSVTNGGATGINLDTLDGTGQVVVGSGTNAGDGGMLTVTDTAIRINNADQVTFSNVTVANTAVGSNGVILTSDGNDDTFFSGLNITTEATGFSSIGAGELSVTATNTIATQTGPALVIHDNLINTAGVTFDKVSTSAGTGGGIDLQNLTGGTVTIGPNSGTPSDGGALSTAGTAISVDNVAAAVFNDITIANTTGPGVNVTNQAAGTLTFNNLNSTTTTADGITIEANTGGTITFDDLNVTTTTRDAIVLDNNTGATITINDMVVNSTVSGNGLTASNGGSLGVSGTNTISTVAGVGLDLSDVTILGSGAVFESVDVSAGASNGIALMNLTGGPVAVGPGNGTPGAGGTLTTASTAVSVDNVASVVINDVTVANTTAAGVNVTNQAAGSTARFENLDVTTTTADAVTISANDAGTITFETLAATTTGAGDGIVIDEADASTVAINLEAITVNATGTGRGVFATGGGVTNITGINTVNSVGDTAFEVNNVQNLSVSSLIIANTAANGVEVTGLHNASDVVNFNTLNVTTTSGNAVTFNSNAVGTINVSNMTLNVTGTGNGYSATGGGTVTATGTNNIDVVSGQGLNVADMTIGSSGLRFNSVDVTAGATTGINLSNLSGAGQVSVGSTGGAAGSGGMLTTAGTAINVNNVDNLAISRVTINNTTGQGIDVTGQDGGTATFTGLDVTTTTADGVTVESNTGGTITFNTLDVSTTTGDAVVVGTNAGATVNFSDMTIASTGSGNGFAATVSGTLNVTGTNTVTTNTGQAINISDQTIGANGVTFDSVDTTAAATAVNLDTLTSGFVRIGSGVSSGDGGTLVASNTAIRVTDVDDATFTNITINNTAANSDGVIISNSAGDEAFFSGMDITSQRTGFQATGGELAVTGTNTISTTSGSGLELNSLAVNIAGVTFESIDVSAGTGTGINLDTLTGGTVTVGPNSGTPGDGGTLVTAGAAIAVNNVAGAVFNDVTATSTGGDAVTVAHSSIADSNVQFDNLTVASASSSGAVITADGAGELDVVMRDSTIGSVGARGVLLDTNVGSDRVDLTLENNNITAGDNNAFAAILDGGTGDVRFLFNDNTMANNSAGSATMDVAVTSALTLNATIGRPNTVAPVGDSNSFTNSNGAGTAFAMDLNNAGGEINLDLRDNTASGGAVDFILTETAGTFGIVDLSNTVTAETNNVGTVDLGANVEGDFDDLVPPIDQVTP